ncbi:MAG TPA: hypothetical protein VG710_03945 [Opitutus sp.]|nr:hypothetical protein [Opitutus sp.]
MKNISPKQHACALVLVAAVIAAGCEGTGPNTQRGAVGGAALGALAGAIIGNNSGGGGHAAGGALIGALAGGLAGGALGNARDHETHQVYYSEDQAATNVQVSEPPPPPPPPPPSEMTGPAPTPDSVWIQGYWALDDHGGYYWIRGHWVIPPSREYTVYHPPHWRHRGGTYIYVRGYWH